MGDFLDVVLLHVELLDFQTCLDRGGGSVWPAMFPPAMLSSASALSASIAANLYNSPNVGVLKQASAKTSDVELLSIATNPIWTISVACSPSA